MKEEYLPRLYKCKGPWEIYVKVIFKSVAPMRPGDPSDQSHIGGYRPRYNLGLYGHQMVKCAEIKLGKRNVLGASKGSPWKEHALNWVEPNENMSWQNAEQRLFQPRSEYRAKWRDEEPACEVETLLDYKELEKISFVGPPLRERTTCVWKKYFDKFFGVGGERLRAL